MTRYTDAWANLVTAVRNGASWSGGERNCCFLNVAGKRFVDVSSLSGVNFNDDGRAIAICDWDRDGDVDLAVSVNGGPLLLLENQGPVNGHWIEIDLRQPGGNRRALGALIRVVTDIATQLGAVGANSSYLSQEPTTRHFGVGQTDLVEVQVRWPDGTEEVWLELAADQSVVLDRGTGTILAR